MNRTLYIGDVHGCADELERIVDAFGFVRGKDTLYQTGDIINKGPDMMRALRFIKDNGILTVRGNHEEHLIRAMELPESGWTEKQRARFAKLSMEEWKSIVDEVRTWPLWRDTPHADGETGAGDPYDPFWNRGYLKTLAENAEFDGLYPDHPLSVIRGLVKYIAEHN